MQAQEENLVTLAADGVLPRDTVQKRMTAITEQRAVVTSRLEGVEEKLGAVLQYIDACATLLERPGELYRGASDEMRRALNQALFTRIYIEADEVTGAEFKEPFGIILEAGELFEKRSTPANRSASASDHASKIEMIARGDYSSNCHVVELRREFENLSPALKAATSRLSRGVYRRDWRGGERRVTDTRGPLVRSLGMTQTLLPAAQVDELVMAYVEGATLVELAERFGVHRRTAAAHLYRRGVSPRTRGLEPKQVKDACRLYAEGLTLIEIGLRFGVSQGVVGRALVKAGHELRPRGRRPHEVAALSR